MALLALCGPTFPAVVFSSDATAGQRFIIAGQQVFLDTHIADTADQRHTVQTANAVWDCSIVLAKYIELQTELAPAYLSNKTVIELGAGTG